MARRRKSYRSYPKKSKTGLNLSTPFLAGLAVGYTNIDKQIPAEVLIGCAVAPVRGFGSIKAGAQGVLFGNLLQSLIAKKGLGGTSAGGMI